MTEFSLVRFEDEAITNGLSFPTSRIGLRPSEASVAWYDAAGHKRVIGKCLRDVWYQYNNIPAGARNPSLEMKGRLGKWDEIGTVEKWKEMGLWAANNVRFFDKPHFVSGEIDIVVRNPVTGGLIGVEMKTFYGYPANKRICGSKKDRTTGLYIPGKPKEEQFLQSCVYKWQFRNILEQYRMYYLERGDGHRLEFEVGYDDNPDGTHQCWWRQIEGPYWNAFKEEKVLRPYTIEDIYKRFGEVMSYVKAKTIPPRDYSDNYDDETIEYLWEAGEINKTDYEPWKKNPEKHPISSWQCSYCNYKEQCKLDSITS